MRSRLPRLAPLAWLALTGVGFFDPAGQAIAMPHVISICSGSGVRLIEIPLPGNGRKRDDCPKGCHALCQRKRSDLSGSCESES